MFKWVLLILSILIIFFRRRNKVIMTCFAGRKFNLEILTKYVDILLNNKDIDEFHLWNFTRKQEDDQYIKTLSSKYKIITPKNKEKWNEYYEYYRNSHDNDVIIKADDDILFIDTVMFKEFINIVRNNEYLAVSASIINNGVCAYHQQQNDILPTTIHEIKYEHTGGDVVYNGELGTKIHEYFTKNKDEFILKSRKIRPKIIKHPIGDRISINFFGITGKNFKNLKFPDNYDDEHEISVENTKRLNKNFGIFMNLVVSHGGFSFQRNAGLDELYICSLYKQIT